MEEWKEYKIGEIAQTNVSQYSLSENWQIIQYLDTGSITMNQISNIGLFNGNEGLPSRARRKVKKGDIIFSAVRPNLCHYGYMDNPPSNLLVSTGFVVITVNAKIVDSRFLYYYLTQNDIVNHLHAIGEQAVSTYPTIRPSDIEDLSVFLPPLYEQKRISSILYSLDSKISCNSRINDNFTLSFLLLTCFVLWLLKLRNDNLQHQADALFKSFFVDFELFIEGEFIETELGLIPKNWKILSFGDFIVALTEKAPVDSLPEYSVTNNGIIPRVTKFNKKLSKSSSMNKVLRKNNLVFGMSREILNWGIMEDEIGGVSSAYNIYKIDEDLVAPTYLRFYMKAKIAEFNSLIGTAAREGQSLDKGQLMQKKIYVPTKDALQDFFAHYVPIMESIHNADQESRHLAQLRDALLPKLMSGELKMNDLTL